MMMMMVVVNAEGGGERIGQDQFTADDELGHAILRGSEFHETGFLGELRLQNCDEESFLKAPWMEFFLALKTLGCYFCWWTEC